jgi:hypothetical protein
VTGRLKRQGYGISKLVTPGELLDAVQAARAVLSVDHAATTYRAVGIDGIPPAI